MEKAIIKKSGAGWSLDFLNGKNPTICNWSNIPKEWDNSEIDVERVGGQPTTLKKGDLILKKPSAPPVIQNDNRRNYDRGFHQNNQNQQRDNPRRDNNNNMENNDKAKSPFNFIQLNEIVVYPNVQKVFFDKYDTERNSGYIDLKIENLTDLMISKGVDSDKPDREHDFLKIGLDNKPIIPGSSLRGLIRKMVGIISYSKFIEGEHYDDHALFYRGVADRAFTQIYQPLFFDRVNNFDYKPCAGYLSKEGNNYKIYPSLKDSNQIQYFKIRNTSYSIRIDHNTKKPVFKFGNKEFIKYDFIDIYFKPTKKQLHKHLRYNPKSRENEDYYLEYALVTEFSFTQNPVNPMSKGMLVISGGMGKKKHDQWIVNLKDSDATPLTIPSKVIEDYKNDKQRDDEYNLLKSDNVPCFYLTDQNGIVTSFGHTPLYRIKHSKSTKNAINQLFDEKKLDFEQMIFGDTEHFASRVFFEDAILESTQNVQANKTLIKILASPKPTSHQFYLKQDSSSLKNWSSEKIEISGTKEYWHKNVNSSFWKDDALKPTKSHPGYIKPVRANNTFCGKIRFENLTNEELGALLFALDLPSDCCLKIGMGKPLGLGTIKIKSNLLLDKRDERYSKLIDANGNWNLPVKIGFPDFKKCFSDYILSFVGNGQTDLWKIERLSQLKAMLEYNEKLNGTNDWLKETRYLEIEKEKDENGELYRDRFGNAKPFNEFSKRDVLDTPLKILTKFKK
jgi:CRISPR-associated protein (TIGR03986 family)